MCTPHTPHQVAVEGVVGPGEVAPDETDGHAHEVQAEPVLVGQLRLTVEHVVPSGADPADQQNRHTWCVCVCVYVCVCVHVCDKKGNLKLHFSAHLREYSSAQ